MQTTEQRQRRSAKTIAWLQIAVGLAILGIAAYQYFTQASYHGKPLRLPVIIPLGVIIPAFAIAKLITIHKAEKRAAENNRWQEPEIL